MFSRIGHALGHRTSLKIFKRTEIVSSIFPDHTDMKLEINYRNKNEKSTNMWRLNNMLLRTPVSQWRNQEELWNYIKESKSGSTAFQSLWDAAKAVMRGNYGSTGLPQEPRKISSNLSYHLKELEKEQTKSKVSKRKAVTKIREEINIIQTAPQNRGKIVQWKQELFCFVFRIKLINLLPSSSRRKERGPK